MSLRDPESVSLLSSRSSTNAPVPTAPDGGVPLQFIQLDDRFRVSRLTSIPLAIMTASFLLSDFFILNNHEQITALSPPVCLYLISFLNFHFYSMLLLFAILLLILLRPIAHKGFPFLFGLITILGLLSVPLGLSLLWTFTPCRSSVWSVPYWHTLILCWLHFWPCLGGYFLFAKGLRDWILRGWYEGKQRGFLSKEFERRPFVGTTQI